MRPILLFALVLVVGVGSQARDKAGSFKAFLPQDAYRELTARSIKRIEEAAKKGDAGRIEVEAMVLAGYALSDQAGQPEAGRLQAVAFHAAASARTKNLKPLADFATFSAQAPRDAKVGKLQAHDLNELMYLFRGKAKGGEGIHPDLQYQAKLQNLNGIEALLGALAKKKLTEENLKKVAHELRLLGYRVAVLGVLTHETPPDKDAAPWRELSVQMRDAAIGLAESAGKKDAEGILKSATMLEASCTRCHMAFKK